MYGSFSQHPRRPTIHRYLYDFIYHEQGLVEINELFCEDLAVAYTFFDDLYLELHRDKDHTPDQIRLREQGSEEPLLVMDTHFDALSL